MVSFHFEIWKWMLVLAMATNFTAERRVIRSMVTCRQATSPLFRLGTAFTFGSAVIGMISGLHMSEQLLGIGSILGAGLLMVVGVHQLWRAFGVVGLQCVTTDDLGFILMDESLGCAAVGFGVGMTRFNPASGTVAHLVILASVLCLLFDAALRKEKQQRSSWFTYFGGLFVFTTGWFLI